MKLGGLRPVLVVLMIVSMWSIALARGAPTKQNAFTHQAVVAVHVAPIVANVPPMTTGFDVIENISTPAFPRLAIANQDILEVTGLSTTGDERNLRTGSYLARSGPQPGLVLLA